jgi:hypothetical protein
MIELLFFLLAISTYQSPLGIRVTEKLPPRAQIILPIAVERLRFCRTILHTPLIFQ